MELGSKLINNNSNKITLSLPNLPEYVSIARLTLAGIANGMGFNIDDIEDLKVALSEVCINGLKYCFRKNHENYVINYIILEKKIIIDVCYNCLDNLDKPKEDGLSLYIIKTLLDEVRVLTTENQGIVFRMVKLLEE